MSGKKIAFIHPDLGIGGAERLVVDAAVGLQELNNDITIYTSHCDKSHCFEEVSSDLLKVKVYGDFLPTNVFKKFHILFAILRQLYLVVRLVATMEICKYDYFIVDQLSFCIPILLLFKNPQSKILFYCHFPDQLLAQPEGLIKKLYRIPFNLIEEVSTGMSDKIVVNSNFTKGVFTQTFKFIKQVPKVIYPCVDINQELIQTKEDEDANEDVRNFFKGHKFFISINRFERKKNIDLAIKAYQKFKSQLPAEEPCPKLVISGGFDSRVAENVEYLQELTSLTESLGLKSFLMRGKLLIMPPATDILFLPSVKSNIKNALIKQSELLLYTPRNEHFGIVPVESMLFKTPVLGPNNGGPIESIVNYKFTDSEANDDEATGFTVELIEDEWAKTMLLAHKLPGAIKQKMGQNGFKVVLQKFSRPQMSKAFLMELLLIPSLDKNGVRSRRSKIYIILMVILVVVAIIMNQIGY